MQYGLEFHIYEGNQLIRRGKYKQFIKLTDKYCQAHYQLTEPFEIELQIQLIRRQLFCYIRILWAYYTKFNHKASVILDILGICMSQLANAITLLGKIDYLNEDDVTASRTNSTNPRKALLKSQPRMTMKQFIQSAEQLNPTQKTQSWFRFQETDIIGSLQEILLLNYLYCKQNKSKEALIFMHRFVRLTPTGRRQQVTYVKGLTMLNSLQFEINQQLYSSKPFLMSEQMLIEQFKNISNPSMSKHKVDSRIRSATTPIVVYLIQESLALEYSNNYAQAMADLQMCHYVVRNIFAVMKTRLELAEWIDTEYQYKCDKWEQFLGDQQEITQFIMFLYKYKTPEPVIKPAETIDEHFRKVIAPKVEVKGQGYIVFNPMQAVIKSQSACKLNKDESTLKDQTTKDNTMIKDTTSNSPQLSPKRVIQFTKKAKKVSTAQPSYLSQLIKLRNLSQYDIMGPESTETDPERQVRIMEERWARMQQSSPFLTVDTFFQNQIGKITFEECLTLRQVEETAKKIISAEWEVHKEMPVTKSLMKSISVSQLRQEPVEKFNLLREYYELERKDFHNQQTKAAQLTMKETKDLKQLHINQHQYQQQSTSPHFRFRTRAIEHSQEKGLFQLQNFDDAGLSPKFINQQIEQKLTMKEQFDIANGIDITERARKEYGRSKQQLMDHMLNNLDEKETLRRKDRLQKQITMPRQYNLKMKQSPRQQNVRPASAYYRSLASSAVSIN